MTESTASKIVWPTAPTIHKAEMRLPGGEVDEWKVRDAGLRHCDYCGSIHPEDLMTLLQTGKARLSGADWKYGFPHKFYVSSSDGCGHLGKFYTRHLIELSPVAFDAFAPVLSQACGIKWERDETGIKYAAPYVGFQKGL